jgi:hypothetical protein
LESCRWTSRRAGSADESAIQTHHIEEFVMAMTPTLWKGQTQVNTTDGNQTQSNGQIAALGNGGYVVVWKDDGSGRVNAYSYDELGNQVTGEVNIGSGLPGTVFVNSVTSLPSGGFAVVINNVDAGDNDLFVRRYDADMNFLGTDVIDTGASATFDANITAFSNGSYVVSYTIGSGADTDIVGRIVQADGTVGAQFDIHNQADNTHVSQLATLASGNLFVAVFQDEDNGSGTDTDISFAIFNMLGGAVTGSIVVDDNSHADNRPDVVALAGGGFAVVWTDAIGDSDGTGITAKIYDSAGVAVTGKFQVNTSVTGNQDNANVVALADGGFVVTWNDFDAVWARGQRFDASGNKIGDQFTVKTGQLSGTPQAALLDDGRIAYAINNNTSEPDTDVVTSIWDPGPAMVHGVDNFDGVSSISSAGDINGDGFEDFIVGTYNGDGPGNSRNGGGDSYVVFGTATGLPSALDLADVAAGNGGFVIYGAEALDAAGFVAAAGDINGDGFDDLLIGASSADGPGNAFLEAGEVHVLLGHGGAFSAAVDLASLPAGAGFSIYGPGGQFGWAVSAAGDVNGDGFDDFIIGAPTYGGGGANAGGAYVVFGTDVGFPATIDVNALADGSGGFAILGNNAGDRLGYSVSSAGDINGDGFDDIVIGAPGSSFTNPSEGAAYVVFGHSGGFPGTIDLDDLEVGIGGFVVLGQQESGEFGVAVSSAGDINGDGFDDLVIGAWLDDALGRPDAGNAYILYGHAGAFPAQVNPDAVLHGAENVDLTGFSVSNAGDINGDGFDDIIIGAVGGDGPGNSRPGAGDSYVVFGTDTGLPAAMDLANIALGIGGFVIYGDDNVDEAALVSAAGDLNGDGYDDLIVAATGGDGPGDAGNNVGEVYVIYGSASIGGSSNATGHVTHQGTAGNDLFAGIPANAEIMIGGNGNDTLQGDGGLEVLYGGQGNDVLRIGDTNFVSVNGGTGNDTLALFNQITLVDADFRNIAEMESIRLGNSTTDITLGPIAARSFEGSAANSFRLTIDGSLVNGAAMTINASAFGRPVTINLVNNAAASVLTGGSGDDIFNGGSGGDTLNGNAGNDTLNGGAGNDILNGMAGANILTGGADGDTFVFDASAFDGMKDQVADYSFVANDVIDLSSAVSTDPANLSSYVQVLQSGGNALLVVDRDGSGSTYGWETIARINNINVGDDIRLLIGPSSTMMTVQAITNPATIPAYTTTAHDIGNQEAWSDYSVTYNSLNQPLSITFNYDDGTHSSTIYDAPDAELHTDYLVTYNAAWGVTRIIFNYDDGTHTVAAYDLADEYDFTDYLATFDAQWNLTRNIFINDDGTNSVRYFDVADEFDWAWQQFNYDSNWNLIDNFGQNDDGSTFGNGYVGNGDEAAGFSGGQSEALPAWLGATDDGLALNGTVESVESLTSAGTDSGNGSFNEKLVDGDVIEREVGIDVSIPRDSEVVVLLDSLTITGLDVISATDSTGIDPTILIDQRIGHNGTSDWLLG